MNIKKEIKKNIKYIIALTMWLIIFTISRKSFNNEHSFMISCIFYTGLVILMVGNIVYLTLKTEKR